MTDDDDLPPLHPQDAEAQASLRAAALAELLNAQAYVNDALETMRRAGMDAGLIAAGEKQLLALDALQRQFAEGRISPGALREAIAASKAFSTSLVQQGRVEVAAREIEMTALQAASAEVRQASEDFLHDYYEKRVFDPYLHFASADDERDYRERETARQRAIHAALAEDTPDGNQRAAQVGQDQLEDAGRHGASDSPDYAGWMDRFNGVKTTFEATKPQRQKAADIPSDPLDDISADKGVDPNIVKTLQLAGVVPTDASISGHGVSRAIAADRSSERV